MTRIKEVVITHYGQFYGANYRHRWPWWFWGPWKALVVCRRTDSMMRSYASPWGTEAEATAATDLALSNGVIQHGQYLMPVYASYDER